jgi:hypothetical protein
VINAGLEGEAARKFSVIGSSRHHPIISSCAVVHPKRAQSGTSTKVALYRTLAWTRVGCPRRAQTSRKGFRRSTHFPNVNRYHVIDKIKDNIAIEADAVYTEESKLYKRMPGNVQKHEIVNHAAKQWVRGDVHTGTIDGYWGLLKRGIIGSFHQISIKHFHRYLSEFQFRWNNR